MAIAEPATRAATRAVTATAKSVEPPHRGTRSLIWPALIYAIVVTQLPFLLTIWYSFQRWNLNRPETRAFIGLNNYKYLFTTEPAFWGAFGNTFVMSVGPVIASLVLGLLFAEVLLQQHIAKG